MSQRALSYIYVIEGLALYLFVSQTALSYLFYVTGSLSYSFLCHRELGFTSFCVTESCHIFLCHRELCLISVSQRAVFHIYVIEGSVLYLFVSQIQLARFNFSAQCGIEFFAILTLSGAMDHGIPCPIAPLSRVLLSYIDITFSLYDLPPPFRAVHSLWYTKLV